MFTFLFQNNSLCVIGEGEWKDRLPFYYIRVFESSSNRVGGAYCIQTGGEEQREFFARIRRGPTLCCCCVSVLNPKNIFFGCRPISRKNTVKKYCCNFFREMVMVVYKSQYYLFFFIYTLYRVFHQEIHNYIHSIFRGLN